MRSFIIALLLLVLPYGAEAKSSGTEVSASPWNYEIERVVVGNANAGVVGDGHSVAVRVWSYATDPGAAAAEGLKNAVHAVIFKGVPAAGRVAKLNPLVSDLSAEMNNAAYFSQFFATGGAYMRYVTRSNYGGSNITQKIDKKTYKVGVSVVVNHGELLKELERAGIVKKLGQMDNAKKPTIMVIPDDVWMMENGYMSEVTLDGDKKNVPDYQRALMANSDLLVAITKMGELMVERGFPLKDLARTMKSIQTDATESAFIGESEGGVAESSLDKLRNVAKADIEIQLFWKINVIGSKKSVTFNLQGLDAYTNKQIAAASGTGNPSFSTELPVMLSEAVIINIDQFNSQLQSHYDDIEANGREIALQCRRTNSSDVTFDSQVGGDVLSFIIEDWVAANTVRGQFNTSDATTNVLNFEQVRIPLALENGRTLDTRSWARNLQRELMSKYKLRVQLMTKGLGQAYILVEGSN